MMIKSKILKKNLNLKIQEHFKGTSCTEKSQNRLVTHATTTKNSK